MYNKFIDQIGFTFPDWSQFKHWLQVLIPGLAVFFAVYFSLNWLTSFRSDHYRFYTQEELAMPFVSEMIFVYLSCYLLPVLPLFFLNKRELTVLRNAFIGTILVAGVCFFLFPAELGFDRSFDKITSFQPLYTGLFMIDLPHNLAPSLHVNTAGLFAFVVANNRPFWFKSILYAWFALICLSILLTHQHHLVDLASGFLLCFVFYRYYYLRKLAKIDGGMSVKLSEF